MNECMDLREWQEEEEEEGARTLTGLIRHLGYCSHCDRHPSSHSEKFTGKGPTLTSDGFSALCEVTIVR